MVMVAVCDDDDNEENAFYFSLSHRRSGEVEIVVIAV